MNKPSPNMVVMKWINRVDGWMTGGDGGGGCSDGGSDDVGRKPRTIAQENNFDNFFQVDFNLAFLSCLFVRFDQKNTETGRCRFYSPLNTLELAIHEHTHTPTHTHQTGTGNENKLVEDKLIDQLINNSCTYEHTHTHTHTIEYIENNVLFQFTNGTTNTYVVVVFQISFPTINFYFYFILFFW